MNEKKPILKIFSRALWFFIFAAIIIASTILINAVGSNKYVYHNDSFNFETEFPDGYDEWASQQNAIFDQHSHTLYSDGKMTVEQNILWHITHGFNVTIISDHNTLENMDEIAEMKEKYKDQIVIIQGIEWTTKRLHMNFLGVSEWNLNIPSNPTDTEIQEAIDEAHNQGAIVTINHIPWSLRVGMDTHPTRQQLSEWGVDFIEIVNSHEYDYDSVEWCNDTGFGIITGTDVHGPSKVCGWTGLNITNFTEAAVMTELRNKRTSIFWDETGKADNSVAYESIGYKFIKPLDLVGSIFVGYYNDGALNWLEIGIFAIYLVLVFIFAEIVRKLNRKYWEIRNAKLKK